MSADDIDARFEREYGDLLDNQDAARPDHDAREDEVRESALAHAEARTAIHRRNRFLDRRRPTSPPPRDTNRKA